MAISYLYDNCGAGLFSLGLPCLEQIPERERNLFLRMLEKRINTPLTSSCGRLFDAVAALVGLRERNSYEGQAAIELEALAERGKADYSYPYAVYREAAPFELDFRLTIGAILLDLAAGEPPPVIARRFHETLAAAGTDVCVKIRQGSGAERVVLSGGVFQNKLLTERLHDLLVAQEFQVFTHRLAPPNDGGLALGQAVIAGQSIR